jgi:hypothetical protein
MADIDLIGNETTAFEQDLVALYRRLRELGSREDSPPCARANLAEATVAVWNAVNDLMLEFDEPLECEDR